MPELSGPLDKPTFGEVPPIVFKVQRKRFMYADLLNTMRNHPGQFACIAVFEKGPPDVTRKEADRHYTRISSWLGKYYPLEAWEIKLRRIQPTWSRNEIWTCYRGELTLEEAQALRAARLVRFQKSRTNSDLKKNARDAVQRLLSQAKVDPHA